MPVPSSISQLSQTASSNSPAGSESPNSADDYFRTYASYIAMLRDGAGFSQEATVASAATTDIGVAASMLVNITGTTTITSFGTNYNGPRIVRFAGALTLTHNASTLILPGGANITTAAGDSAIVAPLGTPAAGWRVIVYSPSSGYVSKAGDTMSGPLVLNSDPIVALGAATKQYVDNKTPPDASTTVKGVVELADSTEAATGTDAARALTPSTLRSGLNASGTAPVYACRAWLNFNGTGTVAIRASGNVSSITDSGVGNYTVNFTTAMPDTNYATIGGAWYSGVTSSLFGVAAPPSSTSSKAILTQNAGATAPVDVDHCSVAFFR